MIRQERVANSKHNGKDVHSPLSQKERRPKDRPLRESGHNRRSHSRFGFLSGQSYTTQWVSKPKVIANRAIDSAFLSISL